MKRAISLMLAALAATVVLAGCGDRTRTPQVTMTVEPAPLNIDIHADGDLQAVTSTPMAVPGPRRSSRQLEWLLPDGSRVKKGEVVARFSAKQSKQDLASALIDLALNQLTLTGKKSDLTQNTDQLNVNIAQVATQLSIANRYANATVEAIARNQILDAVADRHYLTTKQGVLNWRKGQTRATDHAALAVIGAQRDTLDLTVRQKRSDLEALELRAPHDGILMLQSDWNGQKPQVGASFFAGRPFANLPDLNQLEVVLQVPQIESQGLRVGLLVKLHPLGAPAQTATSKVSWVAAAATPISRENPVKYLAIKVPVPSAAVGKYGWIPGMRFAGTIVLLDAKSTLSVPNLALDTRGQDVAVRVLDGGKVVERKVKLGVTGPARSQIVSGLAAGDRVVLEQAGSVPRAIAKAASTRPGTIQPGVLRNGAGHGRAQKGESNGGGHREGAGASGPRGTVRGKGSVGKVGGGKAGKGSAGHEGAAS